MEVRASSVNRGERTRLANAKDGTIFGWDVAGTVVCSGILATTFAPGARVVGLAGAGGGWAERVSVRCDDLAAIPAAVSDESATTLPVAGLTAYRGLKTARSLLGARVLVLGAGGAVGWFGVQLAAMAGAHVSAMVRDHRSEPGVSDLGADQVLVGDQALAAAEEFDFVLDTIGGDATAWAVAKVRPFGKVLVVGNLASSTGLLTAGGIVAAGVLVQGYRLVIDAVANPLGADLAQLLSWVAAGRLHLPEVAGFDWRQEDRLERALAGGFAPAKPVLTIG